MSVDRFARIDANQDGRLDAGEIDARNRRAYGPRHQQYPSPMGNVINMQFADYLAE